MVSLCKKYEITLTVAKLDDYVNRELSKVVETLERKAEPCSGAIEELNRLHGLQKYRLAVVSSSALSRVMASIKKVGMEKYFNSNWVYSAATSLPKPTA